MMQLHFAGFGVVLALFQGGSLGVFVRTFLRRRVGFGLLAGAIHYGGTFALAAWLGRVAVEFGIESAAVFTLGYTAGLIATLAMFVSMHQRGSLRALKG